MIESPKLEIPNSRQWFYKTIFKNFPIELEEVIAWADKYYRVVNKDAEYFDSKRSPWLLEPMMAADDPLVTSMTLVKPIQTGGTSLGEIMLMRWILTGNGLIHYNWPTNDKAKDRWEKFTEKRFKACGPVKLLLPHEYENCFVKFPNITFAMQGVHTSGNLDSDTVDYIVNEEIHQWEPGMLGKAQGRQTRVTFPKCLNISNGAKKGSQLHQEFENGTNQNYLNACPKCRKLFAMRTQWEENRPELGGLRYDSKECARPDGTFDYNKLQGTIRYQFPCGHAMRDNPRERRDSAMAGKYSPPRNQGALKTKVSYTYQAVACHEIRWLDLIMEKHQALRALKAGDDTDWSRFIREREAGFYDRSEDRPYMGNVVVTESVKKNREGLKDRAARIWAADWQQGYKAQGQLTHFWLLIEDVAENCNSQVLFEGQVATESELVQVLKDHDCPGADGVVDCSKNTKQLLSFCYREGLNAVMGNASGQGSFIHVLPDGSRVRKYFAPNKYIHEELNMPPKYNMIVTRDGWRHHPDEPVVILYNKAGLLKNHFFIREMKSNVTQSAAAEKRITEPWEFIERVVPSDVSEAYRKHHEAWERDLDATRPKGMGDIEGFKKVRREDHLCSCSQYVDMLKDIGGILGAQLARLGITQRQENA